MYQKSADRQLLVHFEAAKTVDVSSVTYIVKHLHFDDVELTTARHLRDPVHDISVFGRLLKTFFSFQSTNACSALGAFQH